MHDALVVDDAGVLSGVSDAEAAAMAQLVRSARAAGVRTALLSNAGGSGPTDHHERQWRDLFDVVVLSGVAGVRKPDRAAYELVAQRLGVAPGRCVFVDDVRANVRGAVAAGMTGVHHSSAATTAEELSVLLG